RSGSTTIRPLRGTWVVFSWVFFSLANAGLPLVHIFGTVDVPWLESLLAVLFTLVALYVVGRVTSLVVGRQAFNLFETVLERLALVAKVYTSVRQLIDT